MERPSPLRLFALLTLGILSVSCGSLFIRLASAPASGGRGLPSIAGHGSVRSFRGFRPGSRVPRAGAERLDEHTACGSGSRVPFCSLDCIASLHFGCQLGRSRGHDPFLHRPGQPLVVRPALRPLILDRSGDRLYRMPGGFSWRLAGRSGKLDRECSGARRSDCHGGLLHGGWEGPPATLASCFCLAGVRHCCRGSDPGRGRLGHAPVGF